MTAVQPVSWRGRAIRAPHHIVAAGRRTPTSTTRRRGHELPSRKRVISIRSALRGRDHPDPEGASSSVSQFCSRRHRAIAPVCAPSSPDHHERPKPGGPPPPNLPNAPADLPLEPGLTNTPGAAYGVRGRRRHRSAYRPAERPDRCRGHQQTCGERPPTGLAGRAGRHQRWSSMMTSRSANETAPMSACATTTSAQG